MLTGASPAASARESARKANGIDNQQVLEFLQLLDELRQVAALLEIRTADAKLRVKRSTLA
jgi:hypothetical protein